MLATYDLDGQPAHLLDLKCLPENLAPSPSFYLLAALKW